MGCWVLDVFLVLLCFECEDWKKTEFYVCLLNVCTFCKGLSLHMDSFKYLFMIYAQKKMK